MGYYSEQYPHLKQHFDSLGFKNFEVAIKTLHDNFSDFFNLMSLEEELQGITSAHAPLSKAGSHLAFFMHILPTLKNLHTQEEIIRALHQHIAQNGDLVTNLIFIPKTKGVLPPQFGLLEKIASGTFKVGEPLTFVDMLRSLKYLTDNNKDSKYRKIGVVHLAHLSSFTPEMIEELITRNALFINVNRDLKGHAKWAVLDLKSQRVYCETPLLEGEKKDLDLAFGLNFIAAPEGEKASSLESTGYSATAWLDQNLTRAWNFDANADLATLLEHLVFTQIGGDNSPRGYDFIEGEECYFSDGIKTARNNLEHSSSGGGFAPSDPKKFYGKFLVKLAAIAGSMQWKGDSFSYADITEVLSVVEKNNISSSQMAIEAYAAKRKINPGFDKTMVTSSLKLIVDEEHSVTLNIPQLDSITVNKLWAEHQNECKKTNTNPAWFFNLARNVTDLAESNIFNWGSLKYGVEEEIAAAMILTLICAKAKKPILKIGLPVAYKLTAQEQKTITGLLQNNAFVTQLDINHNFSLKTIKDALIPTLARNRWLNISGYKPPMFDDYWRKAARYWLLHLHEQEEVLAQKDENKNFKECIHDMGLEGLRNVLTLLSDITFEEDLEKIYGMNRPPFYAACSTKDFPAYVQALRIHLESRAYFPFSELGIAYQHESKNELLELISALNHLNHPLKQLQLLECFKTTSMVDFEVFLGMLATEALKEKWVGLIHIPELSTEKTAHISEPERRVRAAYSHLNNIILKNRRDKEADGRLETIKKESSFEIVEGIAPEAPKGEEVIPAEGYFAEEVVGAQARIEIISQTFPLSRGGAVQLQLQQQQQIQQSRQTQQEQQQVQTKIIEKIISGELVNYANIDDPTSKFYQFYQEFIQENALREDAASLRGLGEPLLKGFFHTWVNANPKAKAPYVIHVMTQEAARVLLRKHNLFTAGLHLDNLPRGFYTQQAKSGNLILCYDPEIGYLRPPTPLTLNLGRVHTKVLDWEGDFRQFASQAYAVASTSSHLTDEDINYLMLFALLQPERKAQLTSSECLQFSKDIGLTVLSHKEEKRLKQYYPAFLQAWQYKGKTGVTDLLKALEEESKLKKIKTHFPLLLQGLSSELRDFALTQNFKEKQFTALGQLYYQYGTKGLELFLSKMKQIEDSLGESFFKSFRNRFLIASVNYSELMTVDFFQAVDDMIRMLQPRDAAVLKKAWNAISEKHIVASEWDSLSHFWRAFEYFFNELKQEGIELKGNEFDEIPSQNMLVAMDRILASLKNIPMQEQKQAFIQNLKAMQLQHGGVHYAIQQEGFKYFDEELELHDFVHADPSYLSDLAHIYKASSSKMLKMQRILAVKGPANEQDYKKLKEGIQTGGVAEDDLVLLLLTQYDATQDINEVLKNIKGCRRNAEFAHCIHHATYIHQQKDLVIDLNALLKYEAMISFHGSALDGIFLEALTLLDRGKQDTLAFSLNKIFLSPVPQPIGCSDYFYHSGFKLAALYGQVDAAALQQFIKMTSGLLPVVQNELKLLFKQLLSLDFVQGNHKAICSHANWNLLLQTITKMQAEPHNTEALRLELLESYTNQGIHFKYSKAGDYRALVEADKKDLPDLNYFPDHSERLWQFLKGHVAVPGTQVKEALNPLMRFFKSLQLNRTQINEIEPLLSILVETKEGTYWTAGYLLQLLRSLETKDTQSSYPMSLLKVLLEEGVIFPKAIDEVETNFPGVLTDALKAILENTVFTREQQSLLCKITLHEYKEVNRVTELGDIMGMLGNEDYKDSRSFALSIFAKAKNADELKQRVATCKDLLGLATSLVVVNKHKAETAALWLKALSARASEERLFADIWIDDTDADKRALILHIMAYSCLRPGLRGMEAYEYELDRKALKLHKELARLDKAALEQLAHCYPQEPSPGAAALLHILKQVKKGSQSLTQSIDEFLRNPHPQPRKDYGRIALTREGDFMRMLHDSRISKGGMQVALTAGQSSRLSLIFSYLKSIESSDIKLVLDGKSFVISNMSQSELATAFAALSKQASNEPQNDFLRAQVWAILFEVLARTTGKYPHMAQQFSLIANDIGIGSSSRILQLATGEGKSHFVALRAAKQAGLGYQVEISTAKRTLAERDREDYKHFFAYLGLRSAYIHPLSDATDYTDSHIRYSTLGDLSLFLDEQNFNGYPLVRNKNQCIGLFDEFDFIRFDEGVKTEYNYARPTGRTPKQMTWFYQVVNKFYADHEKLKTIQTITKDDVKQLLDALIKFAGTNEEKQIYLAKFCKDPVQLVQWIQSAHDASSLEWGKGFTVREENIDINGELIPMREIIPLSSDNQRMHGSTFSAGVQQLLAVRLNEEAKNEGKPQNFHIPMESRIISSQVASELIKRLYTHWEGFSGTISALQAKTLHEEQGTEVLHVPTNKRDKRNWHAPSFHENKESQLETLIQKLKACLAAKKSILFSCKNDKAVDELKRSLIRALKQGLLEQEELDQLIFYTNEDKRTAADVLADKQQQEGWKEGKKTKAIGLVASGFGRGDNVGVETVFLFDVSDKNDLMQKGGRTARNGAEGEVFQFYVTEELDAEYEILKESLARIEKDLGLDNDHEEDNIEIKNSQQMFAALLYLRERISALQNAANMGYHHALAQFTAQAMELLAKGSTDPNLRQQFIDGLVIRVDALDKIWISISGEKETSVQRKIQQIERVIRRLSDEIVELASGTILLGHNVPFQLVPYELRNIKQRNAELDVDNDTVRMLTHINSVLGGFSLDPAIDQAACAEIPQLMEHLVQDKLNLQEFYIEVEGIKNISDFHRKLATKVAESPVLAEMRKNLAKGLSASDFSKQKKYASLAQEFMPIFKELGEELTALFFAVLERKNVKAPAIRIKEARPLLEYLARFSPEEKQAFGADYLNHLEQFVENTPVHLRPVRFSGPALSYDIAHSLWKLAARYSDETTRASRWQILQKTLGKEGIALHLALLEYWENWSSDIAPQKASDFLLSFCQLLSQCTTNKELSLFNALVEKTNHQWGNKEQRDELQLLWKRLADRTHSIFELEELLAWTFAKERGGKKAWFSLLTPFASLSNDALLLHRESLQETFETIEPAGDKAESFMLIARSVADLPHARSAADILRIVKEVPEQEKAEVLLNFRLQETKLPAEQEQKIQNELPLLLLNSGMHEHLSAKELKDSLTQMDHTLAHSTPVSQSADVFANKLVNEFKLMPPLDGSYRAAINWYLDFITNHPLSHDNLYAIMPNQLMAFNDRSIKMETLRDELSLYDFSDQEWHLIFAITANQRFDKAGFSELCNNFSLANNVFKEINLSHEEKSRLTETFRRLPFVKFKSLLEQLVLNQEKILKFPELLGLILKAFSANEPVNKCLILAQATLVSGEQAINDQDTQLGLAKLFFAASGMSAEALELLSQDIFDFDTKISAIALPPEQISSGKTIFNNLDEQVRRSLLALMATYKKVLQNNPAVMEILLAYFLNIKSVAAAEILAGAVLKAFGKEVRNETETSEIRASFSTLEDLTQKQFVDLDALESYRDNLVQFNELLDSLVLDKVKSRNDFYQLRLESKAELIRVMQVYHHVLQKNSTALTVLLTYFANFSKDKAAIISRELLTALGEKENTVLEIKAKMTQYTILETAARREGSVQDFQQKSEDLRRVDAWLNKMQIEPMDRVSFFTAVSKLTSADKLWFFNIMEEQAPKYQPYPSIISLLTMQLGNDLSENQMKNRIKFFLSNISTQEALLPLGTRCFSELDESDFSIFTHLSDKMPNHAEALLYDNVAQHVSAFIDPYYQQIAENTLDLFYITTKKEKQPAAIFKDAKVKELFDFDNEDEVTRNNRIIWMHFLNAGAFVRQKDDEVLPNRTYQWRMSEENNTLLQLGFDAYLEKVKKILFKAPEKNSPSVNRDLSDEERGKLLNLSHELLLIGQPKLELSVLPKDATEDLKGNLNRILKNYSAGWFKSTERTEQARQLKESLAGLFSEEGMDARMYQQVLATIQRARQTAMEADIEADKSRFFKLNRSGSSRYLNTLNQLEDMLIRKWVANSHAVQSFQDYRETFEAEFNKLKNNLLNSLNARLTQLDKDAMPDSLKAKADRFFSTGKELDILTGLSDFLEGEQGNDIGELTYRLEKDLTKLPGNIRTMANEVLFRARVLISHPEEGELQSVRKILK